MILNHLVIYTGLGLLSITMIDTLGAVASRKFSFLYTYLAILSLLVYVVMGYFIASSYNTGTAILSCCLVGIYDATAGWDLCVRLKANFGLSEEKIAEITTSRRITMMIIMSAVFGYLGTLMSTPAVG